MKRGKVFWFYGLSGAGKTTLSLHCGAWLRERGHEVVLLDGDELRKSLSQDLGYSLQDRLENVRRAAALARSHAEQGKTVLVALMTPLRTMRTEAAAVLVDHAFHAIHLDCDYTTCASRDAKGLYAQASSGSLAQLPGKDLPFDASTPGELRLDGAQPLEAVCAAARELLFRLLS